MKYVPRLKQKYKNEVIAAMMQQFQYSSSMEVPKLVKITINQGIGAATGDFVDITGTTTLLASPDSDYMTGQIVMIDGGMTLV